MRIHLGRCITLAAYLWLSLPAFTAVLIGHIGNAAVVVELNDSNPAEIEGRYFYR